MVTPKRGSLLTHSNHLWWPVECYVYTDPQQPYGDPVEESEFTDPQQPFVVTYRVLCLYWSTATIWSLYRRVSLLTHSNHLWWPIECYVYTDPQQPYGDHVEESEFTDPQQPFVVTYRVLCLYWSTATIWRPCRGEWVYWPTATICGDL